MKKFFILLLLLILLPLLIGSYYILAPQNLGVTATEADYQSALAKNGITYGELPAGTPPKESLVLSNVQPINASFTDEELTALLERNTWRYNPLKNGSVKINEDGTTEIAGTLDIEKIPGYLAFHDIDISKLDTYIKPLVSLGINPAVHVTLDTGWTNNKLSLKIKELEVGRYTIAPEKVEQYEKYVEAFIERATLQTTKGTFTSVSFKNGAMNYLGAFPTKIDWSRE